MSRPNTWLNDCAANVTSQFGEDGILAKALEVIGNPTGWCVEFGAWDGVHFSNTHDLVKNKGYHAVLIEGSAERIKDLQKTYDGNEKVHAVNAFVGFGGENRLDALLKKTPIPQDFDVLSIDIDGNDYHVWEALREYQPRIVVIEYNPTIPDEVNFVQPADMNLCQGCSLSALVELGKRKGYELVAVTLTNGIFVDRKYFPKFEIADNRPQVLRADRSKISYIFNGYDGTVFIRGFGKVNWHRMDYPESRMQLVPKFLRSYPENYPAWKRTLARWYRALFCRGR